MAKIVSISTQHILDAHGLPAMRVFVTTDTGFSGTAVISVLDNQSIAHLIETEIQAALLGRDTRDQAVLDKRLLELDGTLHKDRLSSTVLYAISLSIARAEAQEQGLPLYLYIKQLFPHREVVMPLPHITMVDNYTIIPAGVSSVKEAIQMGTKIYQHILKHTVIKENVSAEDIFSLITHACEKAGYMPGVDTMLGVQIKHVLPLDTVWFKRYPILSVIDPFSGEDWSVWQSFTEQYRKKFQIAGNKLYQGGIQNLRQGIITQATTAVVVDPLTIGTLTETLQMILMAQEAHQEVILKTGEDAGGVDMAVATAAEQILLGPPQHMEHTQHYNRLLNLQEETNAPLSTSLADYQRSLAQVYQGAAMVY